MILTADAYQKATAQTITGANLESLAISCLAVDAAIRRYIRPFIPTPTTFTDLILDAPPSNVLILPVVPVRTLTSLYLRWGADGKVADFTSDYLQVVNDDYYMPLNQQPENYSRSGLVYRRGSAIWGYEQRRELGRLASTVDPNRGAIKVTLAAGPTSVPADIAAAATMLVTKLMNYRKMGGAVTSAGLNGASYSISGSAADQGIFGDPTIRTLLAEYRTVHVGGG